MHVLDSYEISLLQCRFLSFPRRKYFKKEAGSTSFYRSFLRILSVFQAIRSEAGSTR